MQLGTTPQKRSPLASAAAYALAVAAVALAAAAGVLLGPLLGYPSAFLIFIPPVLFAALALGRGPAVVAALLSATIGRSLAGTAFMANPAIELRTLLFLLISATIFWFGVRLARERGAAAAAEALMAEEVRRAEASREELRLLLEGATHYAIFMVDAQGIVTTWNRGDERILGWTADEALGRDCALFYPPEEIAGGRPAEDLARARELGSVTEETWQVRKDGSEFLADVTTTALLVGDDGVGGFAKIVHDVTDRRAAERALEKRERHLQSILATVPDAMIVIDDRGVMISFSAAAERLFGHLQEDVIGRNVSMLMPSPDRERHDSYLARYLGTGEPHIIGIGRIVTGLRADGTTFPMKLSVGEAVDDEQRLFTGFVQDLTEVKEFESRVEQLKSELIHVSRLSAMGTMASTLAHELNQPLTAIASYGEAATALLEEPDGMDVSIMREIVADMTAQSLRAGAVVRRLREFVSRGDTSKSIEDLPRLIDEASALALVGSREKGVVAQFDYAPEASPVLVDRVQIQQVLINLMRNAMEAMDGCPQRRLTVTTRLAGPNLVEVRVADTGPGIAPEMADRLFEAFASTKSHGMGLGLSICRTIIEAHGGRIKARPLDGGGTEFLFTLVRATGEDG